MNTQHDPRNHESMSYEATSAEPTNLEATNAATRESETRSAGAALDATPPTLPSEQVETAGTPTMEQMLGAATSPSGRHAVTDASADPFETMRTAKELFERRRYTDAARLLEGLADTPEGRSRDARELLARSYYHSAQLTKAAEAARALLDVDPTNADAAVLLTRALERAGKKDEAAPVRRLAESLGGQF